MNRPGTSGLRSDGGVPGTENGRPLVDGPLDGTVPVALDASSAACKSTSGPLEWLSCYQTTVFHDVDLTRRD